MADRGRRFAAYVLAASVAAAVLVAPTWAFANEPEPIPTVEPTEAPDVDQPSPSPEPTVPPSESPTTPNPPVTTDGGATFTGTVDRLSAGDSSLGLFNVPTLGFLAVDRTGWAPADLIGTVSLTLSVPVGLRLSGDQTKDFAALAAASAKTPLTIQGVTSARPGRQTAAFVNQTPIDDAVHRVYAVMVSPNNWDTPSSWRPKASSIGSAIAYADDYWREQSDDRIGFRLVGTVPWYRSSYTCNTEAGWYALWNQAAAKAKTALGYTPSKNNHLMLVFPSATGCDDGNGVATIGWGVNEGGWSWVTGDGAARGLPSYDKPTELRAIARVLGHNMSLGSAAWLDCPNTFKPNPGFTGLNGCTPYYDGDLVDVMSGFPLYGKPAGALSSAQGIRSGIWPSSAWTTAPQGTTSYVLNDVALNAGLRSVVVQDDNGVNYFVEYRGFADEDAIWEGQSCGVNWCVVGAPGIRILRLENYAHFGEGTTGFLGFPGDASLLMGRGGGAIYQYKTSYTSGGIWQSQGTAGLKVTVGTIDDAAGTAAITVEKGVDSSDVNPTEQFWVLPTSVATLSESASTYGMHVGDTWTAFVGDTWEAQESAIEWYRGATPSTVTTLVGTGANYTLAVDDLGMYVGARITGSNPGGATTGLADPSVGGGYGPILLGKFLVDHPGGVSIDNSATPLTATPSGWPSGTTFAYQWFAGSSATTVTTAATGSGAKTSEYTPTSTDKFLRVRVTATNPAYSNSATRYSAAQDYRISSSSTLQVLGLPQVGTELTVDTSAMVYTTVDGVLGGVTSTYQWLRDGISITGNADAVDDDDYTVTAADYGHLISVRVTAQAPGWVSKRTASASLKITQLGVFDSVPTPAISQSAMVLTVDPADSTPTQTSRAYQWYRNGVAVTGKTAVSYTLTQADFGKAITVKVTYKRAGFERVVKWAESETGEYVWSVLASPPLPVIKNVDDGGTIQVGSTVKAHLPTYTDSQYDITLPDVDDGVRPKYQWYRNGVALAGKTFATYVVVAADKGQTLTVKVTAEHGLSRLVSNIATSAGVKIGSATIAGSQNATVSVEPDGSGVLQATVVGLTETPPVTKKYQWYRDGSAVIGKTTAAYTLSSADQGKDVWVRVTISKAAIGSTTYTTVVRDSPRVDYSISVDSSAPPFLWTPSAQVGNTMGVYDLNYETKDGFVVSPIITYQWLRNGSAISGATASTYKLAAADYATTTGVKMTVRSAGYAPLVHTLKFESTIAKGVTLGMPEVEVVAAGLGKVKAQLLSGSLEPTYPTPTLTYQWYRDNPADATPPAKITDATSSTYTLTSSDRGRELTVQVVMKRTNFTVPSMTLARPEATDYTIRAASGAAPTISGTVAVGETLTATPPAYLEADGTTPLFATPTFTYTWYRSGTVISGRTAATYALTASDLGKKITVKVKASLPGRLAHTSAVSLPTVSVALGTLDLSGLTVTTFSNTTIYPKVKADFDGAAATPGTLTYSYQWYRDTLFDEFDPAKISGATASSYALTNADTGKWVTLVVTVKKTGYAPATFAPLKPANFIQEQGTATVSGGFPNTGVTLTAVPPTFLTVDGRTITDYSIQWLVNEGPIFGATGPTFVVTSAEHQQYISYLFTVTSPGHATTSRMSWGVGGAE
jgi:hypothetical protein